MYVDLVNLYGTNNKIFYELEVIKKGLSVNRSFGSLLRDFERNCKIEAIKFFLHTIKNDYRVVLKKIQNKI